MPDDILRDGEGQMAPGSDGQLTGGFAVPAAESAAAFRAALGALSAPGRIAEMSGVAPPDGLSVAAGALLMVLADGSTPVWLPQRLADAAGRWLGFHTGLRLAAPGEAAFAVGLWEEIAPADRFPVGTPEYPDRSATLILEVDGLDGGRQIALSGPGIQGTRRIAPRLAEEAARHLAGNRARFPLGHDAFLTHGPHAIGLPRSTRLSLEG